MKDRQERARLVGARIRAARGESQGTKRDGSMSQEDLAHALARLLKRSNSESLQRSIIDYEGGKYEPRIRNLAAIAEATGKPLDYFVVDAGGDADDPGDVRFRGAA